MKQRLIFHEDTGILEVVASGKASPAGDAALIQAILMHPQFRRGIPVLLDQTDLEIGHLSQQELREVADLCVSISDTLGDGSCAVVVATDLAYGFGRMFESYLDGRVAFRTRIFRTREDALAWLLSPRP